MRAFLRRLDAVHHMKTKPQTTARTETSQTNVTSRFNVTRESRCFQVSTMCVAAAMLCATALSPILPVEAQTCMNESLLYTYDDEPVAKPHRPAHKNVKKSTVKVATAKAQSSSNKTVAVTPIQTGVIDANQIDQAQTAAATATGTQGMQIAGSLTAMRNHP